MDNYSDSFDRGYERGIAYGKARIRELERRLLTVEQGGVVPVTELAEVEGENRRLKKVVSDQASVIKNLFAKRDEPKNPPHYNHPLMSDEEVDRLIRDGMSLHEVMGRRTGKSTAQALRGLAWVIGHPGEVLMIVDHHPSRIANDNLMHTMREMADKLGLLHLVFNRANQTVSFGQPNKDYRQ